MTFTTHSRLEFNDFLPRVREFLLPGLFLLISLLVASPAFASSASSSEAYPAASIHVVGRLAMNLSPQQQRQFEQKTKALANVSRQNEPVISYTCNRDIEETSTYVFDEIWPSRLSLESHLKSDHFLAWWGWVQPLLSRDLDVRIASVEAFHHL